MFCEVNAELWKLFLLRRVDLLKVLGCCWQEPRTSGLFIKRTTAACLFFFFFVFKLKITSFHLTSQMEISSDIDSQAIMSQKEHTSLLAVSSFCSVWKIKIHPSFRNSYKSHWALDFNGIFFLSARWPLTYPRPYWLYATPLLPV